MFRYKVQYAICTDPDTWANGGAFTTTTLLNDLFVEVQAPTVSHARAMVEAMNGGPTRCCVKVVLPL